MTDLEINQAMAKHCGIKLFEESDDQGMPVTVLTEFNTPKYTKDLNEMHILAVHQPLAIKLKHLSAAAKAKLDPKCWALHEKP